VATIDKTAIGLTIGTDVRRAERSIQAAMRDVAQLAVSTIEAAEALDIGAALTHPALEGLSASLAGLTEAHGAVARRAHVALERIGRRIGLTEVNWGPGGAKPAIGDQELESLPA
jgi:hypothetical protein